MHQLRKLVVICSLLSPGAYAAGQWQALPETAPAPADNPTTADKVELGKMLYLSRATISIAGLKKRWV